MKKQESNIIIVKPGSMVGFTVVFSNLPENLEGFSVEVKRFDKGK